MEFDGGFELEEVPPEKAWIVLSDPVAVRNYWSTISRRCRR
ncbi:hypothetical protein [Natronorubrum sp. FCH18a]